MSIKSLTPDRGTDSTQPDAAQTSTWRTLPALAAALLCFSGSQAVFAADDKEADANKAIEEVAVSLPAAPLTENLLPFYDSQSMRFLLIRLHWPSIRIAACVTP